MTKRLLFFIFLTAVTAVVFIRDKKGGQTDMTQHLNRLAQEKSPYLRQHARNPVDWYPWGPEAFAKAQAENKLIFLSIGYSACHWCHVMAHESFENDSIAALMNAHFVNIKVDREEYPDVDHLYQTFVQMTTGSGGWPLSVFLTPERVPVYGGTYFPAESKYGRVGFSELLKRLIELRKTNPEKIAQSARDVKAALAGMDAAPAAGSLPDYAKSAGNYLARLRQSFDEKNGGFGGAPKFPRVADLDFLLRYYFHTGNPEWRHMALFTLKKMALGGIYDQVGGGFHRYSTDARWRVPHFEKMLYDNALLIPLYTDAWKLSGNGFYRKIARETAGFVLRELTDENGGFYASLDADSDGEEGRFYVWHADELQNAVKEDFRDDFLRYYQVTPGGNFEGKNILHAAATADEFAAPEGMDENRFKTALENARRQLLQVRARRVRPGLDDKILTDWNGMMISALWKLFEAEGDAAYRQAAENATGYLLRSRLDSEFRLAHFEKSPKEKVAGYIDDYAYFIRALLDGFDAVQHTEYLRQAVHLTGYVLRHFGDEKQGGFYLTDAAAEAIITRLRQHYDASTPAGNHIMAENLVRLHALTGNSLYSQAAERNFSYYRQEIESRGSALPSLLSALMLYHYSPLEITIATESQQSPEEFLRAVRELYLPGKVLISAAAGDPPEFLNPALLNDRRVPGKTAVFICYRRTCSLPVFQPEDIRPTVKEFGLYIGQ